MEIASLISFHMV
jgi:hypothetical protein